MPLVDTAKLRIHYAEGGPRDGQTVLLLHGWPDDASAWSGVVPHLEAAGLRWIAPDLRGFGKTQFRDGATIRDGSGVAIAQDAFDLMDALGIGAFHIVGHDWGGRATYHMAAMAPARLLSATVIAIGYSPRGRFTVPAYPQCARWWYQWFMTAEAGAQAVRNDPIGFARRQWDTWGPTAWITEDAFAVAAQAFSNPDWVAITLHGYQSRWELRPMDPDYDAARAMVDATETLEVPMLFLQGGADECDPPEESEGLESYFSGGYRRQVLSGVGHFPAREAPMEVAHLVCQHIRGHAHG
ncbi:alpha/beta hydrolase [Luteibacter sp. 9133]|uniref:alpha/beta fold hydrolase n=1 Tax=Luteibacter sp. 9133 TaxID=1500891 RepID=UPI0005B831FC|nr:alpha/beta hydrolase [Luteibacter sp. 9133]